MRRGRAVRRILLLAIALTTAFSAHADVYGRRILGLYKSSEGQTERENEIFFYLSQPLGRMGLEVEYWDADEGLPPEEKLRNVRAVISWFRGPSIARPKDYLAFLNSMVDSGRKLIVFDNLGAYQNRGSGDYLDTGLLNLTLGRLGLMYLGNWTDDPSLLRIASVDGAIAEKGGKQDVGESRFYYRYYPVDRSLRTYLSLERTDRDYGESPIITTNKNGGFALSRYIYHYKDGKVTMLMDLEAFLREALFAEPPGERIALFTDPSDPKSAVILRSVTELLSRGRLPYEVIPKDEFAGLIAGDLSRFTTAALILPDDAGLDPALFDGFLEGGGSLLSLLGGRFSSLASRLAMSEKTTAVTGAKGYRFRFGFLFGEGLALAEPTAVWRPGSRLPSEDADILAHSFDGKIPLLWTARRGEGRILVWNWDGFAVGGHLGPLMESFLAVRPVGITATAGLGVMMLDDWPLPMYNVVKDPLQTTDTEFYTRRFWPEVRDFLDAEEIPFTSYIVFNYNARTEPPFSGGEFFAADNMASLAAAREILEDGRELGFHGYNHLSLTLEKTAVNLHPWPSTAAIADALYQARREWIGLFGAHTLPFSYVPVNNIISRDGEEVLLRSMPSLRVISGLRSGIGEETHTPFGAHPAFPDVYYIPRTSWGYVFDQKQEQLVASALASEGIWCHFIHPDDVYDANRSGGRSWEELFSDFQRMVGFVKRHYPWLRYVGVKDAYESLRRIDSTGVEYRWDDDDLLIATQPGMLFRVRLNDSRIDTITGARIVHEYRRPSTVIVEATETESRLTFR